MSPLAEYEMEADAGDRRGKARSTGRDRDSDDNDRGPITAYPQNPQHPPRDHAGASSQTFRRRSR